MHKSTDPTILAAVSRFAGLASDNKHPGAVDRGVSTSGSRRRYAVGSDNQHGTVR